MRKRWRILPLALLAAGPAQADTAKLPDWLAGCWEQVKGESWVEECWTTARGGMMLGSGRSGNGDNVAEWETMQIVLNDPATNARMVFYGAPNGKSRTPFGWQPGSPGPGLTFFNVANDYPQRIRYWRDGRLLKAEIAMEDGSRPIAFTYRRTR